MSETSREKHELYTLNTGGDGNGKSRPSPGNIEISFKTSTVLFLRVKHNYGTIEVQRSMKVNVRPGSGAKKKMKQRGWIATPCVFGFLSGFGALWNLRSYHI